MRGEWQTVLLGEVCKFQGGSQPPKSKFIDTHEEGYIRLLQIRDFKSDKRAVYIPESKKNRTCIETDIMIGRYGASVGQIHRGKAGAYNVALIRTSPNENVIYKNYFYYFLISSWFQNPLMNVAQRSAQAGFSKDDIHDFQIPLPPLPEQERIVSILDKAFEGIDKAIAQTEQNLASARGLFSSLLRGVFDHEKVQPKLSGLNDSELSIQAPSGGGTSRTKGRGASDRYIQGNLSLSVGQSKKTAREGWSWRLLASVAHLESGHTPSRRHPEYWDGDIPWIGIKDARQGHGQVLKDTEQHTNSLGLQNSSARLLPKGTVCLSRTASVGYVTIMGQEMATSQDFVNWICSDMLEPLFLQYIFLAEGNDLFLYSSGSVHQTIYFPEVKAFHVCIPDKSTQRRIVRYLDQVKKNTAKLEKLYTQKLNDLKELKQSLLQQAFAGELTKEDAA